MRTGYSLSTRWVTGRGLRRRQGSSQRSSDGGERGLTLHDVRATRGPSKHKSLKTGFDSPAHLLDDEDTSLHSSNNDVDLPVSGDARFGLSMLPRRQIDEDSLVRPL